jgi:DNA-binding transcriptional LysR family regulator
MVQAGLGIGVLPRALADFYRQAKNLAVVELDESWAQCDLNVWVRSIDSMAPAVQLFVDRLRASA